MPDNSGSGQSKGKTHGACTLKTPHPNSPSPTELVMLTSNLGPVENEVRTFLEQRALLAIDNNYTAETLANILFNTALKNKLPDITSFGRFLISNHQVLFRGPACTVVNRSNTLSKSTLFYSILCTPPYLKHTLPTSSPPEGNILNNAQRTTRWKIWR